MSFVITFLIFGFIYYICLLGLFWKKPESKILIRDLALLNTVILCLVIYIIFSASPDLLMKLGKVNEFWMSLFSGDIGTALGKLIEGIISDGVIIFFGLCVFIGSRIVLGKKEYGIEKNNLIKIPLILLGVYIFLITGTLGLTYESIQTDLKNIENSNKEPTFTEIIKCRFNGGDYDLPDNATCTPEDSFNAWKCNDGYTEINGSCVSFGSLACKETYGEFSYSPDGIASENGEYSCDCMFGYEFNSESNKCVLIGISN